jgi:hypothetical protein
MTFFGGSPAVQDLVAGQIHTTVDNAVQARAFWQR